MKRNISLKRMLSMLLIAVMVIGMLPLTALAATDLTLTYQSSAPQDGSNRYLIYFDGVADNSDIFWSGNTVYIDGKEVSGDGVHYTQKDTNGRLLLCLSYGVIESGVTTANEFTSSHMLHIKKGTAMGNNGQYAVGNDVWFKLDKYDVTALEPVSLSLKRAGSQDDSGRYAITLDGFADTADKYWNNNTVYIDGEAVSGEGVHYQPSKTDDTIGLYLSYANIQSGVTTAADMGEHIVEIREGTLLGSYVVNKTVKLQVSGWDITQIYDPDVTVTLSNDPRNQEGGTTTGLYFAVSPADSLAFDTANWSIRYPMTTGGIYVNDTVVSGAELIKVLDYLYYIAFDNTGVTFAANDIVKVAGTVTSDGYTVEYKEASFQYDGNGNWELYTGPKTVDFQLNGDNPGGWQGNLNRYLVWLSDDITGVKQELGDVQLLVDGETKTVNTALIVDLDNYSEYPNGRYALLLNANCGISEMGDHTVKITAGQAMGPYIMANDVVFYTHADGGVNTTAPIIEQNLVLSNDWRNSQGNATSGVYFSVSPTDSLAFDAANWSIRYSMTTGGIYVNGEVISGAQLAKATENLYYVAFDNTGVTFEKNDTVKIAGTVVSDGYRVVFAEHTFQYDGNGNWTDYYPVTFKLDEANPGGWQEQSTRYLAYLSDDIAGTKAELGNVQLTIDGETATVETAIVDGRYALLLNANCGITEMGEHCIQITAGQKLGQYTATEDAVFYTHINGGIDTTAPTYVTFGFDGGAWQPNDSRYLIWLSDDIDGEKIAPNSVQMVLDGQLQNVTIALVGDLEGYPNGRLALLLDSACGITEMGEHTVTIAAGQQVGKYVAKESMTAYTHADGSVSGEKRKVSLSIETVTGDDLLYSTKIEWTSAALSKVEQTVASLLGEDELLLGYRYGEDLYRSLCDLPQAENSLTVKAETVSFRVEQTAEIRHGESLTQSGLRFVATLKESDYSKYLFVADSLNKLTGEKADYKIGDGITEDMKTVTTKDGYTCFSLALANIPAADYNKTYYAVGAIAVTYADGTEDYVYTNKVSATAYQAAGNTGISSDSRTAYLNGVINLDAHANPIGNYTYDITVANNANGDYVISYTATAKVEALSIIGKRLTASDGVTFGDGKITVPSGLFASALLQEELGQTKNALQIGAYKGPSIGKYTYTDKKGNTTNYSITRDHDEVYADVEDFFGAGFNIWLAEDWIFGANSYSDNDGLSALDLAAEYCLNHGLTGKDIQVLITDSFLNGLLDGYEIAENAGDSVEGYAQTIKTRFEILKNYNPKVNGVEVGTEYNCFAGYILRDEPYYEHLKYYNGWFSFLGADQGQTVDVIANSAKAGTQVSGTVECLGILSQGYTLYFSMLGQSTSKRYVVEGSTSYDTCTTAEYTAYLKAFVDGVNSTVWNHDNMILAFDNYGLNTTVEGKFGSTDLTYTENMSTTWQENMVLVAKLVQEKNPNATFATALRSFGMTRLSNVDSASSWIKSKTWNEYQAFDAAWGQQAMDLQAYTALAHGYTYLNYFSYWENQNQSYSGETFTDACVMWDTDTMTPVKQNMYYWVQNTNAELRAIEDLFGSFTYSGTAAIASGSSYYGGTTGLWTAEDLIAGTAIASLSASADTTVGHYSKDSGDFGEMFVLVNMTHPEKGSSDTVTLTFDSGYTSVIVYTDGEPTMYQLADSAYTVTIPSGEGVIVIPVK